MATKKAIETMAEPKITILRNPLFHPDLVYMHLYPSFKSNVRIPKPIPIPHAPCQDTISATSNSKTAEKKAKETMVEPKIVLLRNPLFHPHLPAAVQLNRPTKSNLRPDPTPIPQSPVHPFKPSSMTLTTAQPEMDVFLPSDVDLATLEETDLVVELFKRFDYYFEPPPQKPKVQIDVKAIAASISAAKSRELKSP